MDLYLKRPSTGLATHALRGLVPFVVVIILFLRLVIATHHCICRFIELLLVNNASGICIQLILFYTLLFTANICDFLQLQKTFFFFFSFNSWIQTLNACFTNRIYIVLYTYILTEYFLEVLERNCLLVWLCVCLYVCVCLCVCLCVCACESASIRVFSVSMCILS